MSENVVSLKTDGLKDERSTAASDTAVSAKTASDKSASAPSDVAPQPAIADSQANPDEAAPDANPLETGQPLRKREARKFARNLQRMVNGTPRWVSSVEEARILVLNIGIILGLLLGGPIVYKLITRDVLVISDIDVPESLGDRGLSGHVLSQRLYDEIVSVSRFTNKLVEKADVSPTPLDANLPTLELPVGGINLAAVLSQVREFFGVKDRKISGEIIIEQEKDEDAKKPEKYSLRIRTASEGQIYRSAGMNESIDTLLREAAVTVLQRNDPVVAAYYYLLRRDYKEAKRLAEIATASADSNVHVNGLHLKGLVARGLSDWRGAANYFREVIALKPDYKISWSQLASVTRRFDLPETENIAKQMIERFPTYWPAYDNLALVRLVQRRYDAASDLIKQAEAVAPNDPELHFQKMFILRGIEKYEEGLAALDKAQILNPTAIHYLTQAEIIQRDMGNYRDALASAEKIIAIEPTNAEGYVAAARALMGLKDMKRAEEMLRKALTFDAKSAPALANLGRLFALKRNFREANAQFDKALAADSRHYETQEFRADMLVDQKRPDEALPLYLKAIEFGTYPGWLASHPRAKAGKIYEAKGAYKEAIDMYERAMRSDPRAYGPLQSNVDALKAKLAATTPASGAR